MPCVGYSGFVWFFNDSKKILASSGKIINIFDIKKCEIQKSWEFDNVVLNVIISPDEKFVISAFDNYIEVISIVSGEKIESIKITETWNPRIRAMYFSEKRELFVLTNSNIKKYSIIPYLIEDTCARFSNRQLSRQEREKYYLDNE